MQICYCVCGKKTVKFFVDHTDGEIAGIFEKWFATYNSDFYFPYDYTVWQYTDEGSVSGIDGNVDLDLIF